MLPIIPLAIGVGAVVAGAALPALRAGERRRQVAAAKAAGRASYHRLGFCLETIDPGSDASAANLLSRATERWHTAGALLADAETTEQCRVAEQVSDEGMAHVAAACRSLGIAPPDGKGAPGA